MIDDEWTFTTTKTVVNGFTVVEEWDEDIDDTRVSLDVRGVEIRGAYVSRTRWGDNWEPPVISCCMDSGGNLHEARAMLAALQRAIEIAQELEDGE